MITARQAAALASPGSRVLLAGCTGEPVAVLDAVAAEPDLWRNLRLTGAFIPGVNERDYTALGLGTRVETIFTTAGLRKGAGADRIDHLPMHYSDYWNRLARPGVIDIAYTTVPPPSPDGTVGLGLCADFLPAAIHAGARLVGVVSTRMPDVANGPKIPLERFEAMTCAGDLPLPELPEPETDAVSEAIAGHIASMVPPGGTLQLGLGRLQTAILRRLQQDGRDDLGYHAGMISDGVLSARDVFGRGITTGVALGTAGFYGSVGNCGNISFCPVVETHSLDRIGACPGFVAVNSGMEVDLTGQVNAESLGGQQASGQGGLVDFLRGARRSPGGLAVIGLSSTARGGSRSRIVAELTPGTPVSVARADVDMVVTEYGIADLREASLPERARRLTAIAAPQFRDDAGRQEARP